MWAVYIFRSRLQILSIMELRMFVLGAAGYGGVARSSMDHDHVGRCEVERGDTDI